MVLQANYAKRTDAENTPPPANGTDSKSLVSRVRSSMLNASRRRRACTSGTSHSSKHAVGQAKRRTANKSRTSAYSITPDPTPLDVEMDDATRSSTSYLSGPKTTPMGFPRRLGRPKFMEVSSAALQAAEPSLVDTDINHIRDTLEDLGPELLRSLASVKASPFKGKLPKELQIVINDMTTILPTHMLAICGKELTSNLDQPGRVALYPVHSLVFASHCARLPRFPSSLPPTFPEGEKIVKVDVPVCPVHLPSPATYPHLALYLYTKRADLFMKSVLPVPLPPPSTFKRDPSQVSAFAGMLAANFTTSRLVKHMSVVHGVWQNVCALGIFDGNLWETLDTLWELLLTSLAFGTPDHLARYPQPWTEKQMPLPAPSS